MGTRDRDRPHSQCTASGETFSSTRATAMLPPTTPGGTDRHQGQAASRASFPWPGLPAALHAPPRASAQAGAPSATRKPAAPAWVLLYLPSGVSSKSRKLEDHRRTGPGHRLEWTESGPAWVGQLQGDCKYIQKALLLFHIDSIIYGFAYDNQPAF